MDVGITNVVRHLTVTVAITNPIIMAGMRLPSEDPETTYWPGSGEGG